MKRILTPINTNNKPDYLELMYSILVSLKQLNNSGRNPEIKNKIIEINDIKEDELLIKMEGKNYPDSQFNYYFRWSKYMLNKMNLIDAPKRGMAVLNKNGEKISSLSELKVIYQDYKKSNKIDDNNEEESIEEENKEEGNLDFPTENISWRKEIDNKFQKMSSDAFEQFCIRILREIGYEVEVTSSKNDNGIDGIGHINVGLLKFRVVIQCKNHNSPISRPDIDKLIGAMVNNNRVPRGIFMTSSTFTSGARKTADNNDIDLIDFDGILDILRTNNIGIKEQIILDEKFWESY